MAEKIQLQVQRLQWKGTPDEFDTIEYTLEVVHKATDNPVGKDHYKFTGGYYKHLYFFLKDGIEKLEDFTIDLIHGGNAQYEPIILHDYQGIPAMVRRDGYTEYYHLGEHHRNGGPAVHSEDMSYYEYYTNGNITRDPSKGPAHYHKWDDGSTENFD